MSFPRSWKEIEALECHPLSKQYPDITGPTRERMLATLKEMGIANDRKITLHHDGRVLDGWQLLQLCFEAKRKPSFQGIDPRWRPEEFVEVVNDHRRHESQEMLQKRAEARRERVAQAKLAGKPNVRIAVEEGVGPTTIANDLEVLRSQGVNVDPPDGQITDSKGRQQPASKPKKTGKARTLKQTGGAEPDGELKDELDNVVPPGLRPVFEDAAILRGLLSQFPEIKAALNKLYDRPAGRHLHKQEIEMALDNARRSIRFGMPYAVCPVCSGSGKDRKTNCPCKGFGWLPEDNYKVLPQEYRQ